MLELSTIDGQEGCLLVASEEAHASATLSMHTPLRAVELSEMSTVHTLLGVRTWDTGRSDMVQGIE